MVNLSCHSDGAHLQQTHSPRSCRSDRGLRAQEALGEVLGTLGDYAQREQRRGGRKGALVDFLWAKFCRSGTGKLTLTELESMLRAAGREAFRDEARSLWLLMDLNGDKVISKEEFREGIGAAQVLMRRGGGGERGGADDDNAGQLPKGLLLRLARAAKERGGVSRLMEVRAGLWDHCAPASQRGDKCWPSPGPYCPNHPSLCLSLTTPCAASLDTTLSTPRLSLHHPAHSSLVTSQEFDVNHNGVLESSELARLFRRIMPGLRDDEVRVLLLRLGALDPSGRGRVDVHELRQALEPYLEGAEATSGDLFKMVDEYLRSTGEAFQVHVIVATAALGQERRMSPRPPTHLVPVPLRRRCGSDTKRSTMGPVRRGSGGTRWLRCSGRWPRVCRAAGGGRCASARPRSTTSGR